MAATGGADIHSDTKTRETKGAPVAVGDGPSNVPPGWYPDPADAARLRRWDGARWTPDVVMARQPAVPSVPVPQSAPEPVAAQVAPSAQQAAPEAAAQPVYQQPVSQPLVEQQPPVPPVQEAAQTPPEPQATPPHPEPTHAAAYATSAPEPPAPRMPSHAGPSPMASPTPQAPQPQSPQQQPAQQPAQQQQSAPQQPAPAAPTYATPTYATPPPQATPAAQAAPVVQPAPVGAQSAQPQNLQPQPGQPQPGQPHPAQPQTAAAEPAEPPDWAHLPGLTLPPDLSAIPGMVDDAVLPMPRFAEPVRELTPPESMPGYYPPPPQPAGQYAPPPSGFHYDVPPPPGATYVPNEEPALPPSALPPRFTLPPVSAQLPDEGRMASSRFEAAAVGVRGSVASPITQNAYVPMERSPEASLGMTVASGTSTVGVWLIGLLPLIQFAVVYVAFGALEQAVVPGIQWAVILAPAILSVIFASADRRALINKGHADLPSAVFAFIPPLYLLVRCFRIGIGSLIPLIAWVVLQAAAAVGVVILLPTVLAAVVASF